MTLPEIEFDFDGEQIRMAVAPQKNGLQRKPSKPPSGVSRAITLGPGSMRRNAMEPEGAIQEEEGHRAGEKVRDDASMTDEQRQAAAAAERQFRRLQRWEQQIFTGRPAKQQVPRPALRPAGSPPKPRNPSAMSRAKGPNPSAGTGRHVGKLLTKLRGQLGTRYRKQTVMQFKQKDPLSLVNAAMERQTKRETLTEEWDRRKQAQRPGAVPVPTPPELPDEGAHALVPPFPFPFSFLFTLPLCCAPQLVRPAKPHMLFSSLPSRAPKLRVRHNFTSRGNSAMLPAHPTAANADPSAIPPSTVSWPAIPPLDPRDA